MGLFSDHEQEKHEQAYREGVEDAKNAGFWDALFHGLGDVVSVVVPGETTEHQSYERGYHDQQQGRTRR